MRLSNISTAAGSVRQHRAAG